MAADDPEWVLPAGIPFAELKARDLEECVYWLMDAMGARDLEWRTGGAGGGAADGGRDLEATIYVPSPDGEMDAQRWWIECKGRTGTVEPDQVKAAVNNALGQGDLAYLVVVTNTTFSNPTRDWVRQWQLTHPRPRVRLWDRDTLERLLSKHPAVVLRLFSEALSPVGLLKATQERFWNKLEYTPVRALMSFWVAREIIEIGAIERFALIANEMAHGSIADRPWAAQAKPEVLLQTLHMGLVNTPYLRLRGIKMGIDPNPIYAALTHLILVALQRVTPSSLAEFVLEAVGKREGDAFPEDVTTMLLAPVLDQLAGEMQDICSADCVRMLCCEPAWLVGDEKPLETYWRRFDPKGGAEGEEPRQLLRIEKNDAPCKVGYAVDKDNPCPLFDVEPSIGNLAEFLAIIERVSGFRLAQAREQALEDASNTGGAALAR